MAKIVAKQYHIKLRDQGTDFIYTEKDQAK